MGQIVSEGLKELSKRSLPRLEGEICLSILEKEARIQYDEYGIPHVYTQTLNDIFKIQGFLTAQHRGFQLSLIVAFVNARLSEILGFVFQKTHTKKNCEFANLPLSLVFFFVL